MCLSPFHVKTSYGYQLVPCGHCSQCLRQIQNDWKIRLTDEIGTKSAVFFTLTYSNDNLPYCESNSEGIVGFHSESCGAKTYLRCSLKRGKDIGVPSSGTAEYVINGDTWYVPSVSKKDIQDWIKRNRIAFERANHCNMRKDLGFRYFICSEYGPKTFRPHYHGVFIGVTTDQVKSWFQDWYDSFGCDGLVDGANVCVQFEDIRTVGKVANYVSKYCAKGGYDHPLCPRTIDLLTREFNYQFSHWASNGFYFDNNQVRHYEEPFPVSQSIGSVYRTLNTFRLVSKEIGVDVARKIKMTSFASIKACGYVKVSNKDFYQMRSGVEFHSPFPMDSVLSIPQYSDSAFHSYSSLRSLTRTGCEGSFTYRTPRYYLDRITRGKPYFKLLYRDYLRRLQLQNKESQISSIQGLTMSRESAESIYYQKLYDSSIGAKLDSDASFDLSLSSTNAKSIF